LFRDNYGNLDKEVMGDNLAALSMETFKKTKAKVLRVTLLHTWLPYTIAFFGMFFKLLEEGLVNPVVVGQFIIPLPL
jgi:hypothetical protein